MPIAIAGVGGLILGHIVWLIGISMARALTPVSMWVLLFSALFLLGSALVIHQAWQEYQRKDLVRAAFLGGLAFSPVVFTLIVLGVTYL